ncbi:MAG TPA: arylamine N-acetyltransferase [Pyrinomonadaceae bacterium]|nr:arylamine N-acetyltransferase [Pyrinomonadaceae bacterium]
MNIEAYLERINYRGSLDLTAQTLRELQVTHLLTVPFENLSIHAGEPIVLNDDSLFDKVVHRRRGGFCYELNGLFAALLRGLGFKVEMLSAGVANAEGDFGPDFDHMVLMVTLEDRWLVDVGFGDSFREPLLLDYDGEQVQEDDAYRITSHNSNLVLSQRRGDGDWKDQYRFTLQPHTYADYAGMCHFHQTSPQSHFTRARVCTRATPEGRITLSELRFITTRNNERAERQLSGDEEFHTALRDHFGIVMR